MGRPEVGEKKSIERDERKSVLNVNNCLLRLRTQPRLTHTAHLDQDNLFTYYFLLGQNEL